MPRLPLSSWLVAPWALSPWPQSCQRAAATAEARTGGSCYPWAGVIAPDLVTGDILRQTPNAVAGTAAVICPALGGSPAA